MSNDVVRYTIDGSILTIYARNHGYVMLQITASDPYKARSFEMIHITVEQKYKPDDFDQLLVYPNPASDILWYSFIVKEKSASIYIQIVDSSGKIMYQTTNQEKSEGTHYNYVDISNFYDGIYLMQYIKDGKIVDTKKIVKQ